MTRVLVTGGMGMLGHMLVERLHPHYMLGTTLREPRRRQPYPYSPVYLHDGVDLTRDRDLKDILDEGNYDVVINAAGMIKQRRESADPVCSISANALLPHRLAQACREREIRLIHVSTDCVFSGANESRRGPRGYRESDPADAQDLYGRSKLLGEPRDPGCLSLRLSLIGPELRGHFGLMAWFLLQQGEQVPGFSNALFSGITTPVAAELFRQLIDSEEELYGLYHVAAEPISKYRLLRLLQARFQKNVRIEEDASLLCDRRLDGSLFRAATGWSAPTWETMIDELIAPADNRL